MHASLYVLAKKENFKDSHQARDSVRDWLNEEGFADDSARFKSPIADWFVIGGRWSGELVRANLSVEMLKSFETEFEKDFSFFEDAQNTREDRKAQAEELFIKYFPNFNGRIPYFRDNYKDFGYEDDAMIVTNNIYDKIVSGHIDDSIEDGGACIFMENDIVNDCANDIVDKYWIVVVDFHM